MLLALFALLACTGCKDQNKQDQTYLVTVGELTATELDFKKFWESYSSPIYSNGGDIDAFFTGIGMGEVRGKFIRKPFLFIKLLKAKVLQAFLIEIGKKDTKKEAFDQFVMAMLIEARAQDLGIEITNEELEAEIAKLKEDYTDKVFDDTLIKAAMRYDLWSEGLRRRLLMETVMRTDLYARGEITSADVEEYGGIKNGKVRGSAEEVLERVYRAKAEHDFSRWIDELRQLYPVNINFDEWNAVLSE